ncbi:unnamed protein product [Meloidogyne enterolobii]|uniref:Uncharacterized protein n=1 Tax=Meloidogyne enterolobii TaxID=390850 RepID=A0ACB0Y3S3_MELEN
MFLNLIIPKKPRRQFLPLSLSEWDLHCRNKRKYLKLNLKRSKSLEINLFNEEENLKKNNLNIKFRNRAITTTTNYLLLPEKRKRSNYLSVEDRISISSSTCSAPSFTPFYHHNTIAQRIAKRSKSLVKLFNSLKCQRKSSINNEKNFNYFNNKLEKRKSLLNEEKKKEKPLIITKRKSKLNLNTTKEVNWQQLYQSRLKLKMSSTKL